MKPLLIALFAVPAAFFGVAMVIRAIKGGPVIAVTSDGKGSDAWQKDGVNKAQPGDEVVSLPGGKIAIIDKFGKVKREFDAKDPAAPKLTAQKKD
jgi:hypothetical protein